MYWFNWSPIRCCIACEDSNPKGWGHLNYLHQLSQTGVISKNMLPEGHYPALVRLLFWFLQGENYHVNLMCPGSTRYTSMEKDACSYLCNHSGRSRGQTSPVPHFRANLSFPSPSLHIKQHKWLNLHDRICNMANQVSDSIKHYTGTLS